MFIFVSSPEACEYQTIKAALTAAYKQYRLLQQRMEPELSLYQSYICSYLTLLPRSIENNLSSIAQERYVRTEVMRLICNRADLIKHFFSRDVFKDNDADRMLSSYLKGTSIDEGEGSKYHLSNLPTSFIENLAYICNTVKSGNHRGLLTEDARAGE